MAYILPPDCRVTAEEFVACHPDATRVAPGAIVEIVHRAYTVFGSGGAWSRLEYVGDPEVLSSEDQGHNGFCGNYLTRLRLHAGAAVWAVHGDSIGRNGRTFVDVAFIATVS